MSKPAGWIKKKEEILYSYTDTDPLLKSTRELMMELSRFWLDEDEKSTFSCQNG